MENMKEKNMINDADLEQVAGAGIVKDIWEAAEDIAEILEKIDEAYTAGNNTDVTSHGSGASGRW